MLQTDKRQRRKREIMNGYKDEEEKEANRLEQN